jgi:predicted transcriptional regulator
MTVNELSQRLGAEIVAGHEGADSEVKCGYCGDLLSWVMGRAGSGAAWVTVMGNVNAIAVAVLADISCIVLAESSALDDEAKTKADEQGIAVLKSNCTQFDLCAAIDKLIK